MTRLLPLLALAVLCAPASAAEFVCTREAHPSDALRNPPHSFALGLTRVAPSRYDVTVRDNGKYCIARARTLQCAAENIADCEIRAHAVDKDYDPDDCRFLGYGRYSGRCMHSELCPRPLLMRLSADASNAPVVRKVVTEHIANGFEYELDYRCAPAATSDALPPSAGTVRFE